MSKTTSVQKLVKLLQDTQDLESELKSLYRDIQSQQKTHAKIGPFLEYVTGELNPDPDYS